MKLPHNHYARDQDPLFEVRIMNNRKPHHNSTLTMAVHALALASGAVIAGLTLIGARARDPIREADLHRATNVLIQEGEWSVPVDGIRGRLLIAWVIIDGINAGQFKLELELENVSKGGAPIEIWWTGLNSMIDFTIDDASGKSLPANVPAVRESEPTPLWLPLMPQSSVKVAVGDSAYVIDYGAGFNRTATLRLTATQAWTFSLPSPPVTSTGVVTISPPHSIRAVLRPQQTSERRDRAWRGPLIIPGVPFYPIHNR